MPCASVSRSEAASRTACATASSLSISVRRSISRSSRLRAVPGRPRRSHSLRIGRNRSITIAASPWRDHSSHADCTSGSEVFASWISPMRRRCGSAGRPAIASMRACAQCHCTCIAGGTSTLSCGSTPAACSGAPSVSHRLAITTRAFVRAAMGVPSPSICTPAVSASKRPR